MIAFIFAILKLILKNQSVRIHTLGFAYMENSWNGKTPTLNLWVLWIANACCHFAVHVAGWTSSEVAQLIPNCRILSAVGFWVSVNSANVQVTMKVFGCWDCSLAVLGVLLVEQPPLLSYVLSISGCCLSILYVAETGTVLGIFCPWHLTVHAMVGQSGVRTGFGVSQSLGQQAAASSPWFGRIGMTRADL